MELVTLDDDFHPNQLVENYTSLIWTERYSKSGDFELVSENIYETVNLLPKESYVSLRESSVPMVVENHKIRKPKAAAPFVSITGRSMETVLERRATVDTLPSALPRAPFTVQAAKESDAAYKTILIVLDLDPLRPAVDPLDAIPELDIIEPADYSALIPNTYSLNPVDLYTTVMELIAASRHGIKAIRPVYGESQVGVEIYNGADLTSIVVFDARFDQIDDATYLLTSQGSTNVGYVYGSTGSNKVLKTAGPEPAGLERRVLAVEDSALDSPDLRTSRGLIELYKYNALALFDGQVAIQVAEGYNRDYFLGDILKLTGEFGTSQNVRVTEFIRTSDSSGEKSFPAFEAVE